MKWLTGILLFCCSVSASDYSVCAECPWDDNLLGIGGCWEAFGDALYWKEDTGGFQLVRFTQTDPQDGRVQLLEPDYHWGFRLGGTYSSCSGCSYIQASGLYFWGRDRAKRRGNLLPAFVIFPSMTTTSMVDGRLRYDYWNLDLRAGRYLWRGSGIAMHVFAGIRYVNISEKQSVSFALTTPIPVNQVRIRNEFNGAGPEVGLGGEFCIWDGLNIVGQVSGIAVIGPRQTLVDSLAPAGIRARTRFDPVTIIAPGVDLRLALDYSQEICCLLWALELGWELDHYWNVADRLPSFPDNPSALGREIGDIGFSGPYLTITVGF